eukprot:5733007-Amphidinium_carterae.1
MHGPATQDDLKIKATRGLRVCCALGSCLCAVAVLATQFVTQTILGQGLPGSLATIQKVFQEHHAFFHHRQSHGFI